MKKSQRMDRLIRKLNKRKNDVYQLRARLQRKGSHKYDMNYPNNIEWAIKVGWAS